MIDPTEDDIGRFVLYKAHHAEAIVEEGIITSFNKEFVFVQYHLNAGSWATDREDLNWANNIGEGK